MADAYYAITDIRHDGKTIPAGEKVSKSDFGAGWDQLVEGGSVGTRAQVDLPAPKSTSDIDVLGGFDSEPDKAETAVENEQKAKAEAEKGN